MDSAALYSGEFRDIEPSGQGGESSDDETRWMILRAQRGFTENN